MRAVVLLALCAACRFEPGPYNADPRDDANPRDDAGSGNAPDGAMVDSAPPPDAQTSFIIEAEDPASASTLDGMHQWTEATTLAGYSGTGYITALPTGGTPCAADDLFCGAFTTYNVPITVPGTYQVTLRHQSPNGCCDSVHWVFGLNAVTDDFQPDVATQWMDDTSPHNVLLGAGMNTFTLRMREPGTHVDLIRIELQ